MIWVILVWSYRGNWQLSSLPAMAAAAAAQPAAPEAFNRGETIKAALVTFALVAAFTLTDMPHMLIALAGASALLISRRYASRNMLDHVDGDLLLLLIGLFIVNAAMTATGLPAHILGWMRGYGVDLQDPLSMLAIMSVISDIIGNNPAVMLVNPFIGGASQPEALGAAIALGTGLSSSAVIFGSLVGIIVAEECERRGIPFSFREFARSGLPTSIIALSVAAIWIHVISH